ncbi:MAG: sugar isomerase domain-containing protein [Erysipelotrichales bacterium]|nr:MAG: sugar isomerase domain-containing protein [Erysipelotrichales bacterium]
MRNEYFRVIEELLHEVETTQSENIRKAGELIAASIMNGGILQAFGSGHSFAAALEITHRAGGLIPSKSIKEPAGGMYETIEGVGTLFLKRCDIRKEDVVVLISNSGRNPLPIEIALKCREIGTKVIVVTALESSKELSSKHSSGLNLWQLGDVILDNRVMKGDATVEVPGLPVRVCGTSSVSAAVMLNAAVLEAITIMVAQGYVPPVYMSQNVDGGAEFNERLYARYADRLNRQ